METEGRIRRQYRSAVREEGARRTRAAVVAAATRLFVTEGYHRTTFESVAREAGVSRPTVLAIFSTKANLLTQVLDQALAGDDEPVPVRDRPWFQPVWHATTAADVLRAYARVCVLIAQRAGGVVEAIHRAADSDEETAALWERWRRMRRAGAAMVVEHEALAAALRPGLTVPRAGDVLWTLNDPALYTALVHDRGWSARRFETWLASTMQQLLLGGEPHPPRQGS